MFSRKCEYYRLYVFPRDFQKTVLLKPPSIRKSILVLFICGGMRKGRLYQNPQQNLCFLEKDIFVNAGTYLLSSIVLLLEPLRTAFYLEQSLYITCAARSSLQRNKFYCITLYQKPRYERTDLCIRKGILFMIKMVSQKFGSGCQRPAPP